jgi:phage-related tail protein
MTDMTRARAGLEKLLKFARLEAEALSTDLVDVARAQSAAAASLTGLDDDLRREEAMMGDVNTADFAAYKENMRARRHNLQTTLLTLEEAEASAKTRLEAASAEIRKLENLITINERDAKTDGVAEAAPIAERRNVAGNLAARL